jgi:hypothetical protein
MLQIRMTGGHANGDMKEVEGRGRWLTDAIALKACLEGLQKTSKNVVKKMRTGSIAKSSYGRGKVNCADVCVNH